MSNKIPVLIVCSVCLVLGLGMPGATRSQAALSGGLTATWQDSSDARLESESTASADLVFTYEAGPEQWRLYLEANSTPNPQGVSGYLPEANADAGSALDKDNKGRVQVSELNYRYAFNERQVLSGGLLDVSAYFDQSRIASDENTQFLGVSFVQNPTISFPDYTLGLVYEQLMSARTTLRLGLASSHGISDNPNLSYAQLLDVRAQGHGAFAIGSLTRAAERSLLRVGAWAHTGAHESLDGQREGLYNYGAYLLNGYQFKAQGVSLRLGFARAQVARAAGFIGLSYQYRRPTWVFGLAGARIFASPRAPRDSALSDTTHYETYVRYAVGSSAYITVDAQRLRNSNLDASGALFDRQVNVYGLRLTYLYE